MTKQPQDTSAEEPDGGNPHIRFRGGPGRGNQPGLLNSKLNMSVAVGITRSFQLTWSERGICGHPQAYAVRPLRADVSVRRHPHRPVQFQPGSCVL